MQNVELKAELRDLSLARTLAAAMGALSVCVLKQTDTYYRVPDAKLKKRETEGQPTEWVFYSRPNRSKAKLSTFTLYPDALARERFGDQPLPVWTVVKKVRELWTFDGVRIHFDTVEGLGKFIEFEALVCPERNLSKAHEVVDKLKKAFGPAMGELLAHGYAEMLAGDQSETATA